MVFGGLFRKQLNGGCMHAPEGQWNVKAFHGGDGLANEGTLVWQLVEEVGEFLLDLEGNDRRLG